MKIAILLLGLCASLCTWWWLSYRSRLDGKPGIGRQMKTILHSIVAGVAVYFCLLFIALVYLMLTS